MTKEFLQDDYYTINRQFFKALQRQGTYKADPSGWLNTVLDSKDMLPRFETKTTDIHKYHSDIDYSLNNYKEPMIVCLSKWDEHQYTYDEITICHSVTVGSIIVLAALKRLGIKQIIFETPIYFASVEQAHALGLNTVLVPTYLGENFELRRLNKVQNRVSEPYAVWISQPRMSLGMNQDNNFVTELLDNLSRKCFLVIDEATEQYWPSHLHRLFQKKKNLIKIRSITKGLGLNGLRCAYIAHHESLRTIMAEVMDAFQGGIDYLTLTLVLRLMQDPKLFSSLLKKSHEQVQLLRALAQKQIVEFPMSLSNIDNGYIGSVALKNPNQLSKKKSFRETLLRYCVKMRCPVVLGSSMYFAIDSNYEFVRLNYYNEKKHVTEGLRILSGIYEG